MGQDVTALYDARVAEGRIAEDAAQRAVLPVLDRIPPLGRDLGAAAGRAGQAVPPARSPPGGLYLWGGVGRGKSMLMDLFVEATDAAVRRVHFHAFMQEVQAGLDRARKAGHDDAIRPVAEGIAEGLRVLAFDEMQITDIADAMIVGRLFQVLMERGVAIVTTSNRPPDDLYEDGLNRAVFLPFIALLKERLEVIELVSPRDYRQDLLEGGDRYFSPLGATARQAMDDAWEALAGGPGEPLRLPVNGRQVVLPAYRDGVARVGFWELCGAPLGPADYLAVAGAVKVLMLDDVPRLGSENFNAARRFVTLIDALYEARTRLIVSAAAEPDDLYVEGEGSFEFARTASRLSEMRAAGWGAD